MRLKEISWNDKWQNYVTFGSFMEPRLYDRYGNFIRHDLPEPYVFAIIEVMLQLKSKMTVYEAYLKGVEAVFGMTTYNQCGTCLKWLVKLKKQEIKNIKKGVFDEGLADCIHAATRGYERWCKSEGQPN